jgi:hypothetical protein
MKFPPSQEARNMQNRNQLTLFRWRRFLIPRLRHS